MHCLVLETGDDSTCGISYPTFPVILVYMRLHIPLFLSFSPAVSLLGVAGLAETSPSFSVSGPFLLDFPRFQGDDSTCGISYPTFPVILVYMRLHIPL